MMEVAALRGANGLTVASTFSGCGGSCLGLEMAGFDVRWACEFVPAAQETYLLNHPGVALERRDVRLVEPIDVLDAGGLEPGELDVLEGSPPCASFSTAGRREKGWGKTKKYSDVSQRSDDLFFEFVRLLRGLKPRAFIAENVSGLVKGTAKGYFKLIMAALRESGYRVACRVLDAQWLGVPQARQRVIFIGLRDDLGLDPATAYPSPNAFRYSIREALHGLPGWDAHLHRVVHDTSGTWGKGDVTDQPSPTITVGVDGMNSGHFKVIGASTEEAFANAVMPLPLDAPAPTVMAGGMGGVSHGQVAVHCENGDGDMRGLAVGKEWAKLRPGETSSRYFQLVRAHPDKPSPTITAIGGEAGLASVAHPHESRKFTIAELKRICAFPDDFVLTGDYRQQWERLGRSVPPLMMRAVGEALARALASRAS